MIQMSKASSQYFLRLQVINMRTSKDNKHHTVEIQTICLFRGDGVLYTLLLDFLFQKGAVLVNKNL